MEWKDVFNVAYVSLSTGPKGTDRSSNKETQLRAVHVGTAAVQVGAANETQLQTVDQHMADVQTDHGMADVHSISLTHIPFQAWCEQCVRGRAPDPPHRRLGGSETTASLKRSHKMTSSRHCLV